MNKNTDGVRILALLVKNLQYHAPMTNFFAHTRHVKDNEKMAAYNIKLARWHDLYMDDKFDEAEFDTLTLDLYNFYMSLKWYGVIGELIDEDDAIHKLQREIVELKDMLTKVTNQRDEKKSENIILSDQLKDLLQQLAYYKEEVSKRDAKIAELQSLPPIKKDHRYAG
jgi:hypothetical protein